MTTKSAAVPVFLGAVALKPTLSAPPSAQVASVVFFLSFARLQVQQELERRGLQSAAGIHPFPVEVSLPSLTPEPDEAVPLPPLSAQSAPSSPRHFYQRSEDLFLQHAEGTRALRLTVQPPAPIQMMPPQHLTRRSAQPNPAQSLQGKLMMGGRPLEMDACLNALACIPGDSGMDGA